MWTQESGPGVVTFAGPTAVDTTATFSQPGTYVLGLTADDGQLTNHDELTIDVLPDGLMTLDIRVSAGSDDAEESASGSVSNSSSDLELVFDRGGYSGDAFRFLNEHDIGFITYLKGRKARRRYPEKRFRRGWFGFEGQRHTYRLYQKRTRINQVGAIRTILFLGEEGQQIPVLTNLAAASKPRQ